MKKILSSVKKKWRYAGVLATYMLFGVLNSLQVSASNPEDNTNGNKGNAILNNYIVQGIIKLCDDALIAILVLIPAISIVIIGMNWLKKQGCDDEQESKSYGKRVRNTFIGMIVGEGISVIAKLVTGYFVKPE